MTRRKQPGDFLPLPPAPLHIVLALRGGERHGYAIMQDVERLSDGVIRMGPGTLYGTLKRLLEQGLIEESDGPADPSPESQRRRYYRLTAIGQHVSDAELGRLAALVERARGSVPGRLLGEVS